MPKLRPYQEIDVEFLSQLPCAACFNQQRTGKTPTALNVIKKKNLTKVMIVVPGSALYQWKEEYERWLHKPCIVMHGTPKQRLKILENWTHGLIISYDTLKKSQSTHGMVVELLDHNPEMIILDEAHRIKSRNSARSISILFFNKIPNRLILTATPAPGKPEEIFNLLHFLFPEQFRFYWPFIDKYFQKVTKHRSRTETYIDIGGFKPGADKELQDILATFSTQRKRIDVMPWLPKKDIVQVKLPPTPYQTRYLDELTQFWETEHVITQGTLDRLIRYRQICLDPALLELKGNSPKTDWIIQYLQDYPNEQIIVFSKFTSYLKLLDIQLRKKTSAELMIGETSMKQRNILKLKFQENKFKVLLLNINVGKEALTLDAASTIIFTDKYPPIGDIEQAEDRFIASTPEKANKPHKIYELMIKGTYDEQLYDLLLKRKSETDILNDYNRYIKERSNKHGTN